MAEMRIVTGNLLTMDPARPRAEAMALRGDRIVAVGGREEVAAAVPAGTPVQAAPGAAVVPGFNDSHVHMLYSGLELRRLDMSSVRSVGEILDVVARAAREAEPGAWLFAVGNFEVEDLAERRFPTLAELDAASGERPVFIDQRTHDALVNSAALRLAGIDRHTPDPAGGEIERGAAGEPTGRLVERPAFDLVHRLIPPVTHETMLRALREIQPRFLGAGITGVLEPGLNPVEMGAYQDAWARGELSVRTTAMPLADPAVPTGGLLQGMLGTGVRTGFGDSRLRIGGIKVYYDGTGSFGTALIRRPWPGGAEGNGGPPYGTRVMPVETFAEIARFCARERWSLGVHAVGGAAIDEVLAAFEEADAIAPIRPLRFTIIHAYLWPSPENVRLAAKLGVVVALQPSLHWRVAPRLIEIFGEEAIGRATPVRSWLYGGALVAGGSDGPDFPLDPLFGIWQACTRHVRNRDEPLGPHEIVSPAEALELWTARSSYACFADHERGRLAPGQLADWVALSLDPLAVPPVDIRAAQVLQTGLGGQVVFEA
jgi:predicted amidohydrolase YtcJ